MSRTQVNQNKAPFCRGFAPIIGQKPRVLILGTMPSVASLSAGFYYGHPRNAFWPIMGDLFQRPVETEAQKRALIENSPFILWDVLQACERVGSLDSAIQHPQANDFSVLLQQYPRIRVVVFNGQKACQLFQKHVLKKQLLPEEVIQDWVFWSLPSTSPANARMNFQHKKDAWQAKLAQFL